MQEIAEVDNIFFYEHDSAQVSWKQLVQLDIKRQ